METQNKLEKIVALCKRRGFIFPGSDIYGGLKGTWDYGPLGSELKFNIKQAWWNQVVKSHENIFGVQAAIMMNPKVWEGSGHTTTFNDPLVECKVCHERFRADNEEEIKAHGEMHAKKKEKVEWTEPKTFNLLVEARLGVVEGEKSLVYLRGEITAGVHVNFKNVVDSMHPKMPFGIAQIGKAFRNEINPGNFTYRSREFEQAELQWYIKPDQAEWEKWFSYWKEQRMNWFLGLGMTKDKIRFRQQEKSELAHYAREAWDIEYETPFGWKESEGIHDRKDWDLSRHSQFSGQDLSYLDPETNERYIPWVIETSAGVDRSLLFFLLDAYTEEDERIVLKLNPKIAPYKVAVFPLLKNKPELVEKARSVYNELKKHFNVAWDDRGNIGKRYFSQDEIGTPFCVTIDFDTLGEDGSDKKDTVTIRDRDTMKQERIAISELKAYIQKSLE